MPRRYPARGHSLTAIPLRMARETKFHLANGVHRVLMKLSGERLGWRVIGMPVIELTTTGRKSGQPRSTMLTAPLSPGDGYVIVASRGGDPSHPDWFRNIEADPLVDVRTRTGTRHMVAKIASSEERATLWPEITARYPRYAQYQSKTEREIPVVILEPRH